ncbi:MAG: MerR family transcriptional regulator [Ignavibacterium album]|uniref:MerR family transcriptional regulator n=1 Tax=Ignavibacterium album TaxID=591197 RepID=UPI0026EFB01B|nr:MerR family transcriptional regulator [Ignavibacterium album]MCX8105688.1 MerR family transcriptional regulator [Ignavibacterium album]
MFDNFNKDLPIYPISVAAQLLNISVHTLRMYEREGLIIPHKKESNQRLYSQNDLERIECIRKAINESKISINGIKTIYSLIPCWEIVKCSNEDREKCSAYNQHDEPCWNSKHPNTICENKDCRDCEVYKNFIQCGKVKELIKSISR